MRLLGNCSAAGRSGGCNVPSHALAAVDDEGRIKAFSTSLTAVCSATRVRGSRSVMLILRSAHVLSMGLRPGAEAGCFTAEIPSSTPFTLA